MSQPDNATLARRLLEEEFEGSLPNQGTGMLGLLSWLGIGGLFATVFILCGGLGALIGGRELWLEASRGPGDGLRPAAGESVVEEAAPSAVPPVPVEAPPPSPLATELQGASGDAAPFEGDAPPAPPPAPEPEPEPVRERQPAAARPPVVAPVPQPAPAPEPVPASEPDPFEMEIETDDLKDPWKE